MATNFGRDISCTDGIKTGRFVSGVRLVAEALYRRFTTPRGSLLGADNYGLDLTSFLGADARVLRSLPGQAQNEALQDERINRCEVTMTTESQAGRVSATLTVECETDEGPFELQLSVSEVSVELLGVVT
jgi:hypothetical protein